MPHDDSAVETITTRCGIVGGGPAGMMLALLLARAGVDVVVLEKHADFLRDFRGDTIHPSTLELMHELGILDEFLRRPHDKISTLTLQIGDATLPVGDFSHLPTHCKFVALMPQWDFLNFIAERAKQYPTFRLKMQTEATELLREGERVTGVRARSPGGVVELRADLIVAADGRQSTIRAKTHLKSDDFGAPMDVLWMRLSQQPGDPKGVLGRLSPGNVFVMLDRGTYWQCAYVIPKGGYDQIRARGLEWLREEIGKMVPYLKNRVNELRDWNDVRLLTVVVDRLREWYEPGLLCIGDAAHAMSPIGGVGINLAIQDAVAAANILAAPLRERTVTRQHLYEVQHRREWPTRMTQRLQLFMQNRVIGRVLTSATAISPPWPIKLLARCPWLQRIPARVVGMGFRPEHVRTDLR